VCRQLQRQLSYRGRDPGRQYDTKHLKMQQDVLSAHHVWAIRRKRRHYRRAFLGLSGNGISYDDLHPTTFDSIVTSRP